MAQRLGLASLCTALCAGVGADACSVSRVLGDVLIKLADTTCDGRSLGVRQNYLASDFPLTVEVLSRAVPAIVSASDPGADPAEVRLLDEFGFEGLLMLPLVVDGAVWGLVEIYRCVGSFSDEDCATAERVVGAAVTAAAA
jgi:hypothetical protein